MSCTQSVSRFRLKRLVEFLDAKQGRGTELISLYVTPGKQVSDVTNYLWEEYGTASNIKSATTRKNVQDALKRLTSYLKLFKEFPSNGLALFCGAIPRDIPGSEKIELYSVVPPEPVPSFIYRCSNSFYLEPLKEMLAEKEAYGIMAIDASEATYAILTGSRLEVVEEITSGVSGKHRAGGQSARRFQRYREFEINEYFKRAGQYANQIFLSTPNLKGIIVGGPGPTKHEFVEGDYLHYQLKENILAVVDCSYTGEQGVKEVVSRVPAILRHVRYVEERMLMQKFLEQLGRETGLAAYGEERVRGLLQQGLVETLLISEALAACRLVVRCQNCGHTDSRRVEAGELLAFERELAEACCPNCSARSLEIAERSDVVDELIELAERSGADVQMISTETEEGVNLRDSFGKVAAILRYAARS